MLTKIFSHPNFSFALGVGLAMVNTLPVLATPVLKSAKVPPEIAANRLQSQQNNHAQIADGTYLYGESAQPEQLGQEYLVFTVNDSEVVGAVYYPRSEFSCFTGTVQEQGIDLSIVDPYSGEVYAYPLTIQDQSVVAANTHQGIDSQVALAGYQRLDRLSENDWRMLQKCQGEGR